MSDANQVALRPADLDDPKVTALLVAHAERARRETAPGSAHALDLGAFRAPDIDVWSAWDGARVVGVGAWRRLSADHGEIKSMHTVEAARGRGVAARLLAQLTARAQAAGVTRLSLETGAWPYFAPARAFYARHGFDVCGPFGDYRADPNSVFMTRALPAAPPPSDGGAGRVCR